MKNIIYLLILLLISVFVSSCNDDPEKGSYAYDLAFLQEHKELVVLTSEDDQCQVVIVPDYQGRVMTSTAKGSKGRSYGWMHYDLIASGEYVDHYNPFGGEDRLWLGPEGGQYSVFFEKGQPFTEDNWYCPRALDIEPFELVTCTSKSVVFKKRMQLRNYQDFVFDVDIEREVAIFDRKDVEQELAIKLEEDVDFVGYQSINQMTNIGDEAWSEETGLLSIWVLSMLHLSDKMTAILPYRNELQLNTSYFGELSDEYLRTSDHAVFFKCDGKYRSKIGLSSINALPVCGSYDADNNLLTIVKYSFDGHSRYVNSLWKLQDKPYGGDVVNSYNDGPMADGSQMGPFYELESSSAAYELCPNESVVHKHQTFHFEGDFDKLNTISKKILGVDLKTI